jgi:transposase InsO family protein
MDFVHDELFDGRKIRILTTPSPASPAIELRHQFRGADVVDTLERVSGEIGYPKTIRLDNGPEFISKELDLWAFMRGVTRRGTSKMRGLAQRLQRGPTAQRDRKPRARDASSVSRQSRPGGRPMKPNFSEWSKNGGKSKSTEMGVTSMTHAGSSSATRLRAKVGPFG